jgi:hypothetical protein
MTNKAAANTVGGTWPSDPMPTTTTVQANSQTPSEKTSDASFEKEQHSVPADDNVKEFDQGLEVEPRVSYGKFRWFLVCASLYITSFLYGLDTTIAADIQGNIVEDFGQVAKLGWVGGGFVLGAGATILPLGKAYGLFDNKWLFVFGVVMFEAGSALCGGSPSMTALIIGRVWAGVGGSGIYLGFVYPSLCLLTTEEIADMMFVATSTSSPTRPH